MAYSDIILMAYSDGISIRQDTEDRYRIAEAIQYVLQTSGMLTLFMLRHCVFVGISRRRARPTPFRNPHARGG